MARILKSDRPMWQGPREKLTKCQVFVGGAPGTQKAKNQTGPCGAGVAHSLGKGEATSSNLVMGNFKQKKKQSIEHLQN